MSRFIWYILPKSLAHFKFYPAANLAVEMWQSFKRQRILCAHIYLEMYENSHRIILSWCFAAPCCYITFPVMCILSRNLQKLSLISRTAASQDFNSCFVELCFLRKKAAMSNHKALSPRQLTEQKCSLCSVHGCVTCWRCAAGQPSFFFFCPHEVFTSCNRWRSFANGEVRAALSFREVTLLIPGDVTCINGAYDMFMFMCD